MYQWRWMNTIEEKRSLPPAIMENLENSALDPLENYFDRIINDRQMLLNHVKEQSKLGFPDLEFPLSLFHQLASLHPFPAVFVFNMLFSSMVKLKPLQPHSNIINFFNQLQSLLVFLPTVIALWFTLTYVSLFSENQLSLVVHLILSSLIHWMVLFIAIMSPKLLNCWKNLPRIQPLIILSKYFLGKRGMVVW